MIIDQAKFRIRLIGSKACNLKCCDDDTEVTFTCHPHPQVDGFLGSSEGSLSTLLGAADPVGSDYAECVTRVFIEGGQFRIPVIPGRDRTISTWSFQLVIRRWAEQHYVRFNTSIIHQPKFMKCGAYLIISRKKKLNEGCLCCNAKGSELSHIFLRIDS